LYEFNLGKGPSDRAKLYRYQGGWEGKSAKARDPETTALDSLKLRAERRFGYTFDTGDNWEHVIDVVAVAQAPTKGKFPRVTTKVGAAPPQYAEEDE
jgi:Plasmid pRiA4b ORF-3-like protein